MRHQNKCTIFQFICKICKRDHRPHAEIIIICFNWLHLKYFVFGVSEAHAIVYLSKIDEIIERIGRISGRLP